MISCMTTTTIQSLIQTVLLTPYPHSSPVISDLMDTQDLMIWYTTQLMIHIVVDNTTDFLLPSSFLYNKQLCLKTVHIVCTYFNCCLFSALSRNKRLCVLVQSIRSLIGNLKSTISKILAIFYCWDFLNCRLNFKIKLKYWPYGVLASESWWEAWQPSPPR